MSTEHDPTAMPVRRASTFPPFSTALRYALLTSGSRGDVQPFVALGKGLRDAGQHVAVVTHDPFREFISELNLEFRSLKGDPKEALKTDAGRELLATGDNSLEFFRKMVKVAEPYVMDLCRSAWEAVADADVLLCSSSLYFAGEALAAKLGRRVIFLSLQPMAPTREQYGVFQTPLPPRLKFLEGWGYHRLAQVLALQVYAGLYRHINNRVRTEILQMPRRRRWFSPQIFEKGPLFLYGYSSHVVPRPSDWAATQQVCGYWFMDTGQAWQPPADLVQFIAAGSPPVYIGFGSMSSEDPEATHRLVIEALRQNGQRAVISRGWGGMDGANCPEYVCMVDDVPHDWLFPQMAAVVHHGGAGTTATGLRAGTPTVVVAHMADQPYWGRRVQALGAGPAPLLRKGLTPEALAAAIQQAVSDPQMQQAAVQLGKQIRAEDGVATAVGHIARATSHWPG